VPEETLKRQVVEMNIRITDPPSPHHVFED